MYFEEQKERCNANTQQVYCRECFDSRRPTAKSKSKFRGPDGASDPQPQTKKVLCAVEECGEDVTNKGAWVGIYL